MASTTQEHSEEEKRGGEVLLCGCTAWGDIGRSKNTADLIASGSILLGPSRLRNLLGVNVTFVASGSASCHCIAIDVDGRCFTWGRNEKGQLGHGDLLNRDKPTIVAALSSYKVTKAGAGRSHTTVVTSSGDSFAFGWNKHGQLGSGSVKNELERLPVKCLTAQVTHTVCGAEFSVWLSSVPGATIVTAGLPQYGQLGHGTNNEYNMKESSVKMVFEPQPRPKPISTFAGKTITKVACGNNHTVAVDSNGFVYTWGFGGYGRLGHKEQKDEWAPRMVETFQRSNILPPSAVVAAGSAYSACTAGGSQLYMWGKVKAAGENWMYPKPVYDLSNWAIRCMDCGDKTSAVGAEESCITWGMSTYGELGYGQFGPKSSASAKKIDLLEGMHTISVACGVGHTLIVVDRANVGDRLEKIEVYEGRDIVSEPEEPLPKKSKADNKRKVEDETTADEEPASAKIQNGEKKPKGRPKKVKEEEKKPRGRPSNKKAELEDSESDDNNNDDGDGDDDSDDDGDDDDDGESSDDKKKGSTGKGRGRGRGRGQGKGGKESISGKASDNTTTPRGRGRGRGRPPRT